MFQTLTPANLWGHLKGIAFLKSAGMQNKLGQQYGISLEFFSIFGTLGIAGLCYAFKVMESICSNICMRLRWSRGSVLAFSTQVRGFKPNWSRQIFKGEKILSTPSFGGEVKPSVPCHRFAACKRSLNGVEVVISAKLPDNILAHSSYFRRLDLSRRGGRGGTWWWKVGTSKCGGKHWQTTPKNLPRMQRTRAIPVAWLNSGLCPDRPKGWIPIIIINVYILLTWRCCCVLL